MVVFNFCMISDTGEYYIITLFIKYNYLAEDNYSNNSLVSLTTSSLSVTGRFL